MKKIIEGILLGFCVVLLAVVSSQSQSTNKVSCIEKNDLSKDEIDLILSSHNTERASLKIKDIVWDCKLAQLAQEWAARGRAEHRPDSYLGENIFVSSDPAVVVTEGVGRWLSEKKNIVPGSTNCMPGKVCIHYTQVIATISEKIGCGISRNATGKWKVLMVCNYDPAGN